MKLATLIFDPMLASPVFMQEFRSRMRWPWAYWVMGGYLLLLAPAGLYFFYHFQATGVAGITDQFVLARQRHETGVVYAMVMFAAQYLLVTLLAPVLTCASLAGDRARQTLTFLLLTPVPSRDIVTGKMQVTLFFQMLVLLATVPLVALSSLFGGLSPMELLAGYGLLASYALLLTSFGLFMSMRAPTAAHAAMFTYLGALAVPLVFPVLAAPFVGLYVLLRQGDPQYLLSLADGAPLALAAAGLAVAFWLGTQWFVGETALALDYARRMWGTFAPPLRRLPPPAQWQLDVRDEDVRRW